MKRILGTRLNGVCVTGRTVTCELNPPLRPCTSAASISRRPTTCEFGVGSNAKSAK